MDYGNRGTKLFNEIGEGGEQGNEKRKKERRERRKRRERRERRRERICNRGSWSHTNRSISGERYRQEKKDITRE